MSLASRMKTWWRAVTRGPQMHAQVDEELRFHIANYADDLARAGMPRDEAMRRARAELGSVAAARENCRSAWGTRRWDELRATFATRCACSRAAWDSRPSRWGRWRWAWA